MENVLTVDNLATSNPLFPQKVQQIGVCWRQLNAGNLIFLIMQDAWAWHPSRKTRISGRGACFFGFFWLCFDLLSARLHPPSLALLLWRGLPGVSRGHTNRREWGLMPWKPLITPTASVEPPPEPFFMPLHTSQTAEAGSWRLPARVRASGLH